MKIGLKGPHLKPSRTTQPKTSDDLVARQGRENVDSFTLSASKSSRVSQAVGKYLKPALIAAAPSIVIATSVALAPAGIAALALGACLPIGTLAGAIAWGSEIGCVRGGIGGGVASLVGGVLGAIGGPIGVAVCAGVGATREILKDFLP